MNVNSSPTTANWLTKATATLKHAGIDSAQLDALLLLEFVTKQDRAYIFAHPEAILKDEETLELKNLLIKRTERWPIAYLTGKIEFYGRSFTVNESVLVPRPESEALIEELLKLSLVPNARIIDVGTGSGVLGITAALELPKTRIMLTDISETALATAQSNTTHHDLQLTLLKSNLFASLKDELFDVIIANLPYVDLDWNRSPETAHEPELALFAADKGLALIKQLITHASVRLIAKGYIILEADPRQFPEIIDYAHGYSFREHSRNGYCLVLSR